MRHLQERSVQKRSITERILSLIKIADASILYNMQQINPNSTIADLRRQGIKVAVLRKSVPGKTSNNPARFQRETHIVITDKEGKHAEGRSISHPLENYNRKIGNKIALGRAIKNYNESVFCEFYPLAFEL